VTFDDDLHDEFLVLNVRNRRTRTAAVQPDSWRCWACACGLIDRVRINWIRESTPQALGPGLRRETDDFSDGGGYLPVIGGKRAALAPFIACIQ
jgi:hypothetical protein